MDSVVPVRRRIALGLGVLLGSIALPLVQASALQQSKAQQQCINELNKGLAKVAKTMGKHVCKCIKLGAKDSLEGTIEACVNNTSTLGTDKHKAVGV